MRILLFVVLLQLIALYQLVRANHDVELPELPQIRLNTPDIIEWDGNEYKFFADPATWGDAEAKCEVFGGTLLTILNPDENELAKRITDLTCWLGTKKENYWGWIDRSPFTFSSWLDNLIPEALTDACGIFNWNHFVGKWNGVACYNRYPFICKRQKDRCPWGDSRTGAPTPVVTTTFDFDDNLEIKVEMARKFHGGVDYALLFEPIQVNPRTCTFGNSGPLLDREMWHVHHESCSIIFRAKMSLQEFINKTNPSITSSVGSDFVLLSKKIRMSYLDRSEKNSDGSFKCNAVLFDTDIEIRTILLADSSIEFEVEATEEDLTLPPSYVSLSQNEEGKLVVDVVLEPENDFVRFRDFTFEGHSRDIEFTCYFRDYCEDNFYKTGCKYRLTCISKGRNSDYSGELSVKVSYLNSRNAAKEAIMKFKLQYALVEKPDAVLDVIGTSSKLVQSDLSGEVTVLKAGESAYLLTETTEPLQVSQAQFSFEDVYLCCSKNMQPLEPFNPSAGHMGCKVQDPDTMSFWTKLVSNGEPENNMDVVLRNMGPFVKDKIALEFKPNGLEGDDKLCYIHVKSALSLQSHARTVQPEEEYTLESSVPITFKSCTSHATKSGCTASRSCIWKNESKLCTNRYVTQLKNSAAGATLSKGAIAAAAVALVGFLCGMF